MGSSQSDKPKLALNVPEILPRSLQEFIQSIKTPKSGKPVTFIHKLKTGWDAMISDKSILKNKEFLNGETDLIAYFEDYAEELRKEHQESKRKEREESKEEDEPQEETWFEKTLNEIESDYEFIEEAILRKIQERKAKTIEIFEKLKRSFETREVLLNNFMEDLEDGEYDYEKQVERLGLLIQDSEKRLIDELTISFKEEKRQVAMMKGRVEGWIVMWWPSLINDPKERVSASLNPILPQPPKEKRCDPINGRIFDNLIQNPPSLFPDQNTLKNQRSQASKGAFNLIGVFDDQKSSNIFGGDGEMSSKESEDQRKEQGSVSLNFPNQSASKAEEPKTSNFLFGSLKQEPVLNSSTEKQGVYKLNMSSNQRADLSSGVSSASMTEANLRLDKGLGSQEVSQSSKTASGVLDQKKEEPGSLGLQGNTQREMKNPTLLGSNPQQPFSINPQVPLGFGLNQQNKTVEHHLDGHPLEKKTQSSGLLIGNSSLAIISPFGTESQSKPLGLGASFIGESKPGLLSLQGEKKGNKLEEGVFLSLGSFNKNGEHDLGKNGLGGLTFSSQSRQEPQLNPGSGIRLIGGLNVHLGSLNQQNQLGSSGELKMSGSPFFGQLNSSGPSSGIPTNQPKVTSSQIQENKPNAISGLGFSSFFASRIGSGLGMRPDSSNPPLSLQNQGLETKPLGISTEPSLSQTIEAHSLHQMTPLSLSKEKLNEGENEKKQETKPGIALFSLAEASLNRSDLLKSDERKQTELEKQKNEENKLKDS